MSRAHKIRVAVLRGGPSSEYDVSLKTGESVLKHLPASKYEGIDVFISKNGTWHVGGIEKSPAEALKHADVAFVALHGQFGEDGKVQRILEHLGVPFTGSKSFHSAVAMNKNLAKKGLKNLAGKVKMPAHKVFTREEVAAKGAHVIFREIPHPSVVKPLSAGSSVGMTVVRDFFALEQALVKALEHSDSVIIEELIEGREASCGVLDHFRGEKQYAFLPVEMVTHPVNYQVSPVSPGNFDEGTKHALQDVAQAVHTALGLRHYSHSDFIIHPKRGIYFLEVNSLPSLTPELSLSKSIHAVGSSLPEFLDHVITLARAGK